MNNGGRQGRLAGYVRVKDILGLPAKQHDEALDPGLIARPSLDSPARSG
ncbi:hypothetical protein [Micromonospora sp. ATCC 39149]|uniref:Uncharacterized protein n=1 Tax=Micromonospora carbonacea TaxID=47853 RepID=A0A7D6CF04_9ACTN|nr:hypothetical protein [Micromonospora sp. ATCC 39149]QLJ98408.1 hypothetical protein HZU44_27615 [Micromonospora carbonacea]